MSSRTRTRTRTKKRRLEQDDSEQGSPKRARRYNGDESPSNSERYPEQREKSVVAKEQTGA